VLTGIGLMALAIFLFASLDTVGKTLAQKGYPSPQLVWARNVFNVVLLLAWMPRIGARRMLRMADPRIQIGRGVLLVGASMAFFFALRFVPLVDAYAIGFVSPLLVSVFAIPILGEQIGWRRWTAVTVGFVGVLIVARPGLGVTHWAASLVLVMAGCFALYQVLTRKVAGSETAESLMLYPPLVGSVVLSAGLPLFWTPVEPLDWIGFAALGVLGGVGHGVLVQAMRRAPASVLAPFVYTQLIWGLGFGWLVFGDLPDLWTVVGALVVTGSGVYVLYREATRVP
jgi:drug/metabolite transporter (DMT)-like permease